MLKSLVPAAFVETAREWAQRNDYILTALLAESLPALREEYANKRKHGSSPGGG